MADIITEPVVQMLGMQGEHFLIKVKFVIIAEDNTIRSYYGLILKMKAEDLPTHSEGCETVQFDVGRAWRDYDGGLKHDLEEWRQATFNAIESGRRITDDTELDLAVKMLLREQANEFVGEYKSPIDVSLDELRAQLDQWQKDILREPGKLAKDMRVCPGCHTTCEYNAKWGNIAQGKGTVYGCPACVERHEKMKEGTP